MPDPVEIDSVDSMRMLVSLHERVGVDVPDRAYARPATVQPTVDDLPGRLEGGLPGGAP